MLTFAPQSTLKVGDIISLVPTSLGANAVGPFASTRTSRRHPHRTNAFALEAATPLPSAPASDDFLPLYADLRSVESKADKSTKAIRRAYRRRFISSARRLFLWRSIYRDVFARVYYRRWGLYTLRRRLAAQLRRKVRPFVRPVPPVLPFLRFSTPNSARRAVSSLHRLGFHTAQREFDSLDSLSVSSTSDRAYSNSVVSSQFRHLLKASLSLRLRASLLPRISTLSGSRSSGGFHRPFLRSRRRRYLRSRRFKALRLRKLPRLRPVHRYIPSYLQRDFRTLRAIRIHSPNSESVVFPFRGSLAQVEAFYRSRAF